MKGPLTRMVEGRVVKDILKDGTRAIIRYMDGTSHTLIWVDEHGRPIRGEPQIQTEGWHIFAKPVQRIRGVYRARESGLLEPARR